MMWWDLSDFRRELRIRRQADGSTEHPNYHLQQWFLPGQSARSVVRTGFPQ